MEKSKGTDRRNPFITIDYEALERLLQIEINGALKRGSLVMISFSLIISLALGMMHLLKPHSNLWVLGLFMVLISAYAWYVHSLCSKKMIAIKRAIVVTFPVVIFNFVTFLTLYFFSPSLMWTYVLGPGSYSYFVVIIITGFVFNSGFSRLTGLVTGAMYYASYLMMQNTLIAMGHHDPACIEMLSSPYQFVFKSLIMVFAGFLVGALSDAARKLLASIIREEQEKSFISSTFGMIVDPRVKEEFMSGNVDFGGEVRNVTVLFADIRGFTSFSEKMPPGELLHFMKEYFDLLNDDIAENEGTIVEYVGDEVMVLFGAPLIQDSHSLSACMAAFMMQETLEKQRPLWQQQGKPPVRSGIGIHTGPMLVGNIGSSSRFKYGAIGDNVNLGSRLQALTKIYDVDIIASENTVEMAGSRFHTRELDRVSVRGRKEEVTIYEIIAPSHKKLTEARLKLMDEYQEGRSAYQKGEKALALEYFMKCLEMDPADGPTKYFLEKLGREEEQQPGKPGTAY